MKHAIGVLVVGIGLFCGEGLLSQTTKQPVNERGAASAMPQAVADRFGEYKQLLQQRMEAGIDVSAAEELAHQADAAMSRGDENRCLELLDQAFALLGGTASSKGAGRTRGSTNAVPVPDAGKGAESGPARLSRGGAGASAMPQAVAARFGEYKQLLQQRMEAGVDVSAVEELAHQADAAMSRGDENRCLELLDQAFALLGGSGSSRGAGRTRGSTNAAPAPARSEGVTPSSSGTSQTRAGTSRSGVSSVGRVDEDSPFGIHPARVEGMSDPYTFATEAGIKIDRPSALFIWGEIQPDLSKPEYTWSRPLRGGQPSYDDRMKAVPSTIRVLGNFYTEEDRSGGRIDAQKYSAFVRATVERYDGDGINDMPGLKSPIKYWQVGNEPIPSPDSPYVTYLDLTCAAVKQADPTAVVVAAGPVATPMETESFLNSMCRDYVRYFLTRLPRRCFDVFDVHFYGNARGDYRRFEEVYTYLRSALDSANLADVPMWVTEMGTYSGEPKGVDVSKVMRVVPGESTYQSEELQAADVLKRYVLPLSLGVEKVLLAWGLVEGYNHPPVNGYFDCTGLIFDGAGPHDRGKNVRKLAYFTYQMMTEKLEGSDWKKIETLAIHTPHVYGYRFPKTTAGKAVYVLWWDWFAEVKAPGSQTRAVAVPFQGNEAVVTEAVTGMQGERHSWKVAVTNGVVNLRIGASPVFLE